MEETEKSDDVINEQSSQGPSFSRWGVFGFVAIAAALTTMYVYNVIEVNRLLQRIRQLEGTERLVQQSNELLETKVIELQSAERICTIARDKLGMILPDRAPEVLQK